MDPRFQPQNPHSHPPGPSHNPYYVPEAQPGPNKYPTLPPIQNPQPPHYNPHANHPPQYNPPHQHNPQLNPYNPKPNPPPQYNPQPQHNSKPNPYNPQTHHSHPQQNYYPPQNNTQYPKFDDHNSAGGPPGYIPPAQYGNNQVGPVMNQAQNEEKFKLDAEMRDLERELESCGVKCYKFWSWWTVMCGIGSVFYSLTLFAIHGKHGKATRYIASLSLVYSLWSLIQSTFGALAIMKKDLSKANVACWLMSIFLVLGLLVEIILIAGIRSYAPPSDRDQAMAERAFLGVLLGGVTMNILIHMFVNLINAFKVKRILTNIKNVEMRLIEIESSFNKKAHNA